ncbi:MAG: pyrimidine 5'-nucleotidase [Desulfonatronovibrio sp.]
MKTFIFDLDNTLYSKSLNVFGLIDKRINRYMTERVGIPEPEVDALRRHYWKIHGVTLNGLILHHEVDPEDFLEFVHDVDLDGILKPDRKLRIALKNLDARKVIFTNGSIRHAENVLSALGIEDLFEEIFDVRIASFKPKPFPEPYLKVLEAINVSGHECVMIDDILENLRTAKDLGMSTVLIGTTNGHKYVDFCIEEACAITEFPGAEFRVTRKHKNSEKYG